MNGLKVAGIIPARYDSSRFPGKPLERIGNQSMIERVFRQAQKSNSLIQVLVATDDERIFEHVRTFGGNVVFTKSTHLSGTERCAEAVEHLQDDITHVINIQGDEPFISPAQIDQVAEQLKNPEAEIATLVNRINNERELTDEQVVKVVFDHKGKALYFSRSKIPFSRNAHAGTQFYRHVGIYGYKREVLKKISVLQPSSLELAEQLEQLRWLENGYTILTSVTEYETMAVDTPADLQRILKTLQ